MTVEEVRDDLAGADLANDSWLVYRPEAEGAAGRLCRRRAACRRGVPRPGLGPSRMAAPRHRFRACPPARASGPRTPDARCDRADPHPGVRQGRLDPERQWPRAATWSRRFWRMRIDLESAPPEPEWPEGITVRDFVPGQDERAMYDTQEAAFADHWGHVPRPYEDFVKRLERSDFDPSLWHMALDGDTVVGAASNSTLPDGVGQRARHHPQPSAAESPAPSCCTPSASSGGAAFMAWRCGRRQPDRGHRPLRIGRDAGRAAVRPVRS